MRPLAKDSARYWIARHALCVWIGIFLNFCFIIPLFFYPRWMLNLFGVPLDQLIWARFAAVLLTILSVFYIPPTIDFSRYRVYAWLAVFPSRTFGATFFTLAVLLFNQPPGFLSAALLDAVIGAVTLYCLIKINAREREEELIGGDQ